MGKNAWVGKFSCVTMRIKGAQEGNGEGCIHYIKERWGGSPLPERRTEYRWGKGKKMTTKNHMSGHSVASYDWQQLLGKKGGGNRKFSQKRKFKKNKLNWCWRLARNREFVGY